MCATIKLLEGFQTEIEIGCVTFQFDIHLIGSHFFHAGSWSRSTLNLLQLGTEETEENNKKRDVETSRGRTESNYRIAIKRTDEPIDDDD